MTRSELYKLIQDKVDAEVGNRTTGDLSFKIRLQEGGIRQVEAHLVQALKVAIVRG